MVVVEEMLAIGQGSRVLFCQMAALAARLVPHQRMQKQRLDLLELDEHPGEEADEEAHQEAYEEPNKCVEVVRDTVQHCLPITERRTGD